MKTVKSWKKLLNESYSEYDEEMFWQYDEDERLSPQEVLDIIVSYNGGLASASEVVELVNFLWNIDLEEIDNE